MPTVSQSDNSNITKSSPGLIMDEFIPLVSFKTEGLKVIDPAKLIFEHESEKISFNKDEKHELSDHINNEHKSIYRVYERTTSEKEKISIPFFITKGNEDSDDDDGIITAILSEEIEGVSIISKQEFKASYNSDYNLELELKLEEAKSFYIDFYAKDDEEDEWNKGELENVHCGRVKVNFKLPLNLKSVFYAISLMDETDYRSNNLRYFRPIVKVKNHHFSHTELGGFLAQSSDQVKKEDNEYDGEEIKFLSIFSHGYENNIFGDNSDTINKSEISAIFSNESIHFSKNAIIFLGACNSGTGKLNSFAQELANITNVKVIGMVDDGVAVVSESTGNSKSPKMIYGPKYGDKYNGKFYEFKKDTPPLMISKEYDIINLVDKLKAE